MDVVAPVSKTEVAAIAVKTFRFIVSSFVGTCWKMNLISCQAFQPVLLAGDWTASASIRAITASMAAVSASSTAAAATCIVATA